MKFALYGVALLAAVVGFIPTNVLAQDNKAPAHEQNQQVSKPGPDTPPIPSPPPNSGLPPSPGNTHRWVPSLDSSDNFTGQALEITFCITAKASNTNLHNA